MTQWSAGVLAGWLGGVLAADPASTRHSLVTRRRDAAEPAGEDASAPSFMRSHSCH
jgi:hypothetical protein